MGNWVSALLNFLKHHSCIILLMLCSISIRSIKWLVHNSMTSLLHSVQRIAGVKPIIGRMNDLLLIIDLRIFNYLDMTGRR